MNMQQKRAYIETYGCQMNEHDSERIIRLLESFHYLETEDPKQADLILINTCSVREKPEHKVYSALGRFKKLKEEKGTIIGVAGCVAQQEGERLLNRVPYLDIVIGTHAIPALPELVQKVEASRQRVCETGFDTRVEYLKTPLPQRPLAKVKSYVTIMQGCDRFCSFCIVPYVRGRERSRSSLEIIEEVCHLAEMGVKEVCLLGQNVNGYGKELEGELDFPGLLERINDTKGLERIRFTTSHPADLSEELIQAFSKLTHSTAPNSTFEDGVKNRGSGSTLSKPQPLGWGAEGLNKLCEHIHLPFQSGSNKILKAMHRGYTRESYLEKIARLREVCPSIALTADVIVGFPGEEEEDFEETLDLMKKAQFDDLFSFKYSPRKGTRAAQFQDQVEEKVKKDRLSILQSIQKEITLQKNQALEGCTEEVLVEGPSKQSDRDVTGRTRSNKIVNFEGDLSLVGKLVPVRITKAYPHSLRGEKSV
jgi:tRNA-2-methylthio-N6-dimethylallyladenosine synthase